MQARSPGSLSLDSILKISAFIFVHNVSLEPLFRINIDSLCVPHGFLPDIVIFQGFCSARKYLLYHYSPVSPYGVRGPGTEPGSIQAINHWLIRRLHQFNSADTLDCIKVHPKCGPAKLHRLLL